MNLRAFLAAALFTVAWSSVRSDSTVSACDDLKVRNRCGSWLMGSYASISETGEWFAGAGAGFEYFFLPDISIAPMLSPGFGSGAVFASPSADLNYYLWRNSFVEIGAAYSARYFYQWPVAVTGVQGDGLFHGPGAFASFALGERLYAGLNVAYQWIVFRGEDFRSWYFTIPVFWYF